MRLLPLDGGIIWLFIEERGGGHEGAIEIHVSLREMNISACELLLSLYEVELLLSLYKVHSRQWSWPAWTNTPPLDNIRVIVG